MPEWEELPNRNRLARSVAQTLGRQTLAIGVGLVLSILIARFLGPEGNGSYALALLLPSFLVAFLSLGVGSANVYFVGQGTVSLDRAFKTTVRLTVLVSLVGIFAGTVLVVAWRDAWFPGISAACLWFALISFPWVLLQVNLSSLLQATEQFARYNGMLLFPMMASLVLSVIGFWIAGASAEVAVAMFAASQCIGAGWSLISVRQVIKLGPTAIDHDMAADYLSHVIRYGVKTHLSNALTFLSYRADVFLLNYLLSPVSAGIYVVATQLAERLWVVSQAVSTVLLPRLAHQRQEERRRRLTAIASRWVLASSLVLALILVAVAAPIIRLLFGPSYSGAAALLIWMLPGIVFGSVARVLASDMAARGRPDLNFYVSIVIVIINISLNILMIPRFDSTGAAASTSIAYCLNALVKLVIFTRLSGCSWRECLVFTRDDLRLVRSLLIEDQHRYSSETDSPSARRNEG